ncbi:hypothetical protein C8F04DRAFT_1196714 [Mycena alexandri]|uniref:Uncharacterized protein n=1 Tax=Mycena alexandri TaxID=1745969 RepID=A0AAD6S3V8_9AGAR|nr:hypothetical protein C8F04DRAFT_1196714 [Mycena alexandri]
MTFISNSDGLQSRHQQCREPLRGLYFADPRDRPYFADPRDRPYPPGNRRQLDSAPAPPPDLYRYHLGPGPHDDRERAPAADAGHRYADAHVADRGRSYVDRERPTLDDHRPHDDRFSLKEYDDRRPREERDDRHPYTADAHPRMDLTQLVPKKPAKRVRADNDEAAEPSNKRRNTSESHGLGAEAVQQQSEDLGEDNARGSKRPREESDEAEVLPWPGEGETVPRALPWTGPYRLRFYIKKSQDEMDADPDDKKHWRMSTDFYATHFVAKRHPTTADDHTFTVDPNNPDTWIRMSQRIGNGMNARGKQWDFEWSWRVKTLTMVFEFSLDVTSPTFLFETRALVGRFRKHNENGEG